MRYSDPEEIFGVLLIIFLLIMGVLTVWLVHTKSGVKANNEYEAGLKDTDYNTDYDSMRQIEETLRSYIASYEADKVIYETNCDLNTKESIALANAARSRANRTAATYNQFYLKNSYIWKDNIPADICAELEYLQ